MRSALASLLALSLLGSGGCDAPDAYDIEPAKLRLFAFPREVEPGGQATVTVEVDVADCHTVCVGLPATPDGGRLFPPPGVQVPPAASISLPSEGRAVLQSITYVAPSH